MKGRIFHVMIKHTYFNSSKTWNELYNYKTKNLAESSWAELARADFYVGRVGMGRVGFGPSFPAPDCDVKHLLKHNKMMR